MEVQGTVVQVIPIETFQDGKLRKQTFVIEIVDGQYTNHLAIDQWNDKITQLALGQSVTVKCNVRSRQGKGQHAARWFTNVSAWSTTVESRAEPAAEVVAQAAKHLDALTVDDNDGLPF